MAERRPEFVEPVSASWGIKVVVSAILSLFGLFGKGTDKKTAKALEDLRKAQVAMGDGITAIAEGLSRSIGKIFRGVEGVFARVLIPTWTYLKRITDRLTKVIDRILKRYQEIFDNIRRRVLAIYDKFFRPILDTIQKLRKLTAGLRVLGVKWAAKLDARLAKLEGKIISPILAILKRLDEHSELVNILLTARGYLQIPVLLASLWRTVTELTDLFWWGHTGPSAGARAEQIRRDNRPLSPAESKAGLQDYLSDRSGALRGSMNQANLVWARRPKNPTW